MRSKATNEVVLAQIKEDRPRKLSEVVTLEGPRLTTGPLDTDVGLEAQLVESVWEDMSPQTSQYAMVVRCLSKSYGTRKGVSNLSFLLRPNQVRLTMDCTEADPKAIRWLAIRIRHQREWRGKRYIISSQPMESVALHRDEGSEQA